MVRRLAGRERQTPPPRLRQQNSGGKIPSGAEQPRRERAVDAPYSTGQAIAEAWAKAAPEATHIRHAANELKRLFTQHRGRVLDAHVVGMVESWKARWQKATVYSRLSSLRRILREIDDEIGTKLRFAVGPMRKPEPRTVTITESQYHDLLKLAPPFMRLFLLLTCTMALRFSEAWSLTPEQYDDATGSLTALTKGGVYRTFPAPPPVQQMLRLIPEGKGGCIARLANRPNLSKGTLRKAWNKLKKQAGLPREIIPHDLRRSAAVRMYEATHDLYAVKQLLGHDDLGSTTVYLKAHEATATRQAAAELTRWQAPAANRKEQIN